MAERNHPHIFSWLNKGRASSFSFWRGTICHSWGSPSCPCTAFVSRSLSFPPRRAVTLLHKDLPSRLYIVQSPYLGWNLGLAWNVLGMPHSRAASCCCVSATIMQSWGVQDLPYWWNEVLCCLVWWKKANMVSMNGRAPPSHCANAIMASQYADIFSIYIWRTENGTKGDT